QQTPAARNHRPPNNTPMSKFPIVTLLSLACAACSTPPDAANPGHRVLTQGNGKLCRLDRDGQIAWQMPWGGIHDLHVLPSGHIMLQAGPAKVVEIDPTTQQVTWQYDATTANDNQ